MELRSEQAELLIAWGRQPRDGKSMIRAARWYEQCEAVDLEGKAAVEVFCPAPTDGRLRNARQALRVFWTCSVCDRVRGEQVADLQASAPKGQDACLTDNSQWVVAPWVQEILAEHGVQFRPAKSGCGAAQVVGLPECTLATEVFPVQLDGAACPGCGRRNVHRSDWMEGAVHDWAFPDVSVNREHPLTLRLPVAEDAALMRADVAFEAVPGYSQRPHMAGAEVKDSLGRFYLYSIRPAFFVGTELARRLLAGGVKGMAFRPVHTLA